LLYALDEQLSTLMLVGWWEGHWGCESSECCAPAVFTAH